MLDPQVNGRLPVDQYTLDDSLLIPASGKSEQSSNGYGTGINVLEFSVTVS